jgi:hypothetical protein
VIPSDLKLDPLSLAVWFMDDGCKSHRALYLNTQSFNLISQQRLVDLLSEDLGIKAALNRDKQYWRIRVAVSSVPEFKSLVIPYLLPQFEYKFPQ